MQFAIQDIRKYGNLKIAKLCDDNFLGLVYGLNSTAYSVKCSAYGFPLRWGRVRQNVESGYQGLERFVKYCEPMIDDLDLSGQSKDSAPVRRKFRNMWSRMWAMFAEDLGLSRQNAEILYDYGLRLAFLDLNDIPEIVLTFYNAVLSWFVLTQYESNLTSLGLSWLDILHSLILCDSEEFALKVVNDWR